MNKKLSIGIIFFLILPFLFGDASGAELQTRWFIQSKTPLSYAVLFPGIKEDKSYIWLPQYLPDFRTYILRIETETGKVAGKFLIQTKFGKLIGFYGKIYKISNFLILPGGVKNSLPEYSPPILGFWNIKKEKMQLILNTWGHVYNDVNIGKNALCLWTTSNEIFLLKVMGDEIYIRKLVTYSPFPPLNLQGRIYEFLREGFIKTIVGGDKDELLLLSRNTSPPNELILVKIDIKGYTWTPQKWLKLGEGDGMWIKNVATSGEQKEGYYLGEKGLLKIIDLQNLEIKKEKQIFKKPIQIIDALSYNSRRIITVIRYSRLEKGRGGLTAETYSFPYIVVINPKTFQKEWELVVKGEVKKPALSIKGEKVFFWVYNREKDKSYLCGIDIRKKQVLFCEETDNTLTIPPLVVGNTLITLWKPSQGSKEKEGYKAFGIPRFSLPSSFSQGIIIERKEGKELEFPKEEMFEEILDKK